MTGTKGTSWEPAARRSWPWLVVGLVVLGLAIWVVESKQTSADAGITRRTQGLVQQFPVADRQPVETFVAETLDGDTIDTTTIEGPIVFNMWGSWCAPCRSEAPALARLARELKGEVTFVGINIRDGLATARAFERSFDMPYPSVTTEDSRTALIALGSAGRTAGVPTTYVVDAEGRLAARLVGETTYRTFREVVQEVLDESQQ